MSQKRKNESKVPSADLVPEIAPSVFTDIFAEELYQLWVTGFALYDIYLIYCGTEKAFNYKSLLRLKDDQNWEARRKELVTKIRKDFDDTVKLCFQKQFKILQFVLEMNSDKITRDFKAYFKDPDGYPRTHNASWLIHNMKDLGTLIKAFNDLSDTNVKSEEPAGYDLLRDLFGLNGEIGRAKVYGALKEAALARNGVTQQVQNAIIPIPEKTHE